MAFDDLRYPSLAPPKRELVEDGLQEGLGVIPGETPSRKFKVVDDFGENYPAARGVIPGSKPVKAKVRNVVTAQNIPTKFNRAKILEGAQNFEDPYHANLIRVD